MSSGLIPVFEFTSILLFGLILCIVEYQNNSYKCTVKLVNFHCYPIQY